MEILDYVTPVDKASLDIDVVYSSNDESFYHIDTYTKNNQQLRGYNVALLGVEEERNTQNKGTKLAPDEIRKELYKLANTTKLRIIDLGNIRIGKSLKDTYVALSDIIHELVGMGTVPIILGGGQDLTYSIYVGVKKLIKRMNLLSIDAKIDLRLQDEDTFDSESYLNKILLSKSKKIFNYVNLGHQAYYCSSQELKLLSKKNFDAYRLGEIRTKLSETEPILRDANIVSVDISSIKQSDAPGYKNATPNGFYSEEMCQLARYAGISDNVKCFGLFEVNPEYDVKNQTSALAAQIIWYFIDGVSDRTNDYPTASDKLYTKFIVCIDKTDQNIIFYQNNSNKRWWVEVPHPTDSEKKVIVSCNHSDYVSATHQEIPECWFNTVQKMI